MKFTDVCFITEDVLALRAFYEKVFENEGEGDHIHSAVHGDGIVITLYHKPHAQTGMGYDLSGDGRGLSTVGFNVEDVDKEYDRIKALDVPYISEPVVKPWGAKSFTFKDPDGNRIVMRTWVGNNE